jgi:hypothetical protein
MMHNLSRWSGLITAFGHGVEREGLVVPVRITSM